MESDSGGFQQEIDLLAAEAEVARLMRLNGDKGAVYFWQTTRILDTPTAAT